MRLARRPAVALIAIACCQVAWSFDLQGHRGARGLEPENTLPAFERALAIGVTTLELDVGITADGVLVVSHERRLTGDLARDRDGRSVDDPGPTIASLTLAQLREYDVGSARSNGRTARAFPRQARRDGVRIPTLNEVFALARGTSVRFNIETKLAPSAPHDTVAPEPFARALVQAIRAAGLARRVSIQSFDWRTLAVAAAIAPEIARVHLTTTQGDDGGNLRIGRPGASPWLGGRDIDDVGGSAPRLIAALGGHAWSPDHRDLTPAALREAHALGLRVVPWTVNDEAEMARWIALGVDGLITDAPDRLRALLDARGIDCAPMNDEAKTPPGSF